MRKIPKIDVNEKASGQNLDSNDYDRFFKILISGPSDVGKSNIMSRLIRDEFNLETRPSIGMEFSACLVENSEKIIEVQLWDRPGNPKYFQRYDSHYRGAVGHIVVYDISKSKTFFEAQERITEIREESSSDIPIMLIGNKCDLRHLREVPTGLGKEYAEKNGVFFIEASAHDGTNVDLSLQTLVHEVLSKSMEYEKRWLQPIAKQVTPPKIILSGDLKSWVQPIAKQITLPKIIQVFLGDLKAVKDQLRADCQSTFTFSLDRKRLGFQALDALEKSIMQDLEKLRDILDAKAYIKAKINNIKNDPQYMGIEGGVFNATNDLFLKYSAVRDDAQEKSCVIA